MVAAMPEAWPYDDLAIPDFLVMSPEDREAAWRNHVTTQRELLAPPRDIPPEVAAERERQAQRRAVKTANRIGAMKARMGDREARAAGMRWDVSKGQWVAP